MVANAHWLQLDLSEVRRRFAVSLKGATLAQLITHASQLNFNSRPLRLELEELAQLTVDPCRPMSAVELSNHKSQHPLWACYRRQHPSESGHVLKQSSSVKQQ